MILCLALLHKSAQVIKPLETSIIVERKANLQLLAEGEAKSHQVTKLSQVNTLYHSSAPQFATQCNVSRLHMGNCFSPTRQPATHPASSKAVCSIPWYTWYTPSSSPFKLARFSVVSSSALLIDQSIRYAQFSSPAPCKFRVS